jgi:phosphotransferase system HPr-like phosphotransfer protein
MSLGVPVNKTIQVTFHGKDEDEAFKAITRVINEINEMK